MRPWWGLYQAATGIQLDYAEFLRAGERLLNLDRAFIVREGFRRVDDHLPYRMMHEAVPRFNYPPITREVLDGMLDEYYTANGWDLNTSIPTTQTLHVLGMEDVAASLRELNLEVAA
jgi:aldehyde:ferredoxin oxidoreductase